MDPELLELATALDELDTLRDQLEYLERETSKQRAALGGYRTLLAEARAEIARLQARLGTTGGVEPPTAATRQQESRQPTQGGFG